MKTYEITFDDNKRIESANNPEDAIDRVMRSLYGSGSYTSINLRTVVDRNKSAHYEVYTVKSHTNAFSVMVKELSDAADILNSLFPNIKEIDRSNQSDFDNQMETAIAFMFE